MVALRALQAYGAPKKGMADARWLFSRHFGPLNMIESLCNLRIPGDTCCLMILAYSVAEPTL